MGDPRLSEACRRFHGAWASPSAIDVIVRTVEDTVANRSAPSYRRLRQPFGTCDMPYGRLAQGGNFYLEVPKTGSTTMKARFKDGASATDDLPPGFPRSVTKSFVFVREPLRECFQGTARWSSGLNAVCSGDHGPPSCLRPMRLCASRDSLTC